MESENSELFLKAQNELDVPIPRKLKFRPFIEAWDIWGSFYLSACLVIFYSFLITNFVQSPYLSFRYGKPTLATISSLYDEKGRYGYEYYIKVNYLDNYIEEQGTIEIPLVVYQALKKGEMVNIHYLSLFYEHPSLDISPPWSADFLYYIMFILLLIPVGLFGNNRYLLVRGKVVIGRAITENGNFKIK